MEVDCDSMDDANKELKPLHPLFASADGDITLAAKDGKRFFRVHSFILKTASSFFKTMFSLPQKPNAADENVVYLDEDAETLEHLLRMICGLPLLPIDTWDLVDALLDAIEKYDMPGPLSIIRLLVMTPALLNQPFRLYAVASRFQWDTEAKFASTQTLSYDLHDPDIRQYLRRMPTEALLSLIDLHRCRREG